MRLDIGSTYVGTVIELKPYGAVLKFPDESTQLLHISHVSDEFIHDLSEFVNVGESVEVYAIPGKTKPIEITIRQSEIDKYEKDQENKSFEELLNDYPPNERDIRYKDRYSTHKNNKHRGSKNKGRK